MNLKNTLRTAAALLLATTAVGSARAYTISAPGSVVAGKTIADWSVEWWKWAINSPADSSGLDDASGALTQLDNKRAVFLMGGGANGYGPATSINVTVPVGKPILLRLVNFVDYEPDGLSPGTTLTERQTVATDIVNGYDAAVSLASLSATIDGNAVADLAQYRERVPGTFSLGPIVAGSLGEDDADGYVPGVEQDPAAASGFYLMLNGLSLGRHTLSLHGSSAPFDVTTVGGALSFDGYGVDQTINLDVAAVPEPASWALLLSGFGLTGALMRRRQTNVVTA